PVGSRRSYSPGHHGSRATDATFEYRALSVGHSHAAGTRRTLPASPPVNRDTVRAAGNRGLRHPIDAGLQSDKMAPGSRQLVLRNVPTQAFKCRLPAARCALRVPVQLVLQRRGRQVPAASAGLVSPPTVGDVDRYRQHLHPHVPDPVGCASDEELNEVASIVTLGLNHEQQHQELIVTDLKHMLSHNPLHPVYVDRRAAQGSGAAAMGWVDFAEGIYWIGHDGQGFAFDNEGK